MDEDAAVDAEEHGGEQLQAVAGAADAGASVFGLSGDAPWAEVAFGFFVRQVDPDVDLVVGVDEGHVLLEVGVGIEVPGAAEGGRGLVKVGDAVEAEGAHGFAGEAMADEVPAAVGVEDGVGLDVAV